jgi:3-hydroxyacyl-CoA dehydrogenase
MSASATVEYAERIALVTVSNPPVNTISSAVRDELHRVLDRLEPRVEAVVLLCSGSTFFSGADIAEFGGPPQEEAYRALFRRLEGLPVPVIAAMHGTVLGGGLEISLACHYR